MGLLDKWDEHFKPEIEIKIGGASWKSEEIMSSEVEVHSSVFDGVNFTTIKLVEASCKSTLELVEINDYFAKAKIGQELKMSVGYDGKTECVFTGLIVRFKISALTAGSVLYEIEAMDHRVLMMANCNTRYYDKKKKSQVAKEILSDYGKITSIKVDVRGEPEVSAIVFQNRVSDYQFVVCLADELGALFFVDADGKMNFLSLDAISGLASALPNNWPIFAFETSVDALTMPSEFDVKSTDINDYTKEIVGEVKKPDKIGNGKTFDKFVYNISKVKESAYFDASECSKQVCEYFAKAMMNIVSLRGVRIILTVAGYPVVQLGAMFKVSFIKEFAGEYIVTAITHIVTSDKYITKIELASNTFEPLTPSLI